MALSHPLFASHFLSSFVLPAAAAISLAVRADGNIHSFMYMWCIRQCGLLPEAILGWLAAPALWGNEKRQTRRSSLYPQPSSFLPHRSPFSCPTVMCLSRSSAGKTVGKCDRITLDCRVMYMFAWSGIQFPFQTVTLTPLVMYTIHHSPHIRIIMKIFIFFLVFHLLSFV